MMYCELRCTDMRVFSRQHEVGIPSGKRRQCAQEEAEMRTEPSPRSRTPKSADCSRLAFISEHQHAI